MEQAREFPDRNSRACKYKLFSILCVAAFVSGRWSKKSANIPLINISSVFLRVRIEKTQIETHMVQIQATFNQTFTVPLRLNTASATTNNRMPRAMGISAR